MISAYVSTLGFGTYYYFVGIPEIYIPTYVALGLFIIYGTASFFTKGLVTLFRLSIVTASLAFYNQVFYTGGITSPALFEFVIPPLLAFFYRPVIDRYLFIAISFIAMLSFVPLSLLGYTQNLLTDSWVISHATLCGIFVFLIVAIFSFLFRSAIVVKNEKLGNSIKQLQETTQRLVESEKMASLGLLSAGVAHEINNPLNFIKGGVEALEQGLKNGEINGQNGEYLAAIKEGLNRTATIVSSMNHFSRQTDKMDEVCDIHTILKNCIIMLKPKLKSNVAINKSFDSGSAIVIGNEGKLHQSFLNIIANAADAIETEGTISIKTGVKQKEVRIEISDTGLGISEENLSKIRDPFFTTKPVGKGTGLGLAIAYKSVEEHGGKIHVTSIINKGTTFEITLPLR